MKQFGTAVILCGGRSIRMGFDKSMIKVKNKFLTEIIGEQLEKVFEKVILISKDKEKFKNMKYEVLTDEIPDSGPLGAIYTALKNSDSRFIFVTACDMPFININYIRYMQEIIKKDNVEGVATFNQGFIEPLYAFYSRNMIPAFEMELKRCSFKLNNVLRNSNVFFVEEEKAREYSKELKIFTNLNYISDLSILEEDFAED